MAECILKNNDITKFDIIPVGGAIFTRVCHGSGVVTVGVLDLTGSERGLWSEQSGPGKAESVTVRILLDCPENWRVDVATVGVRGDKFTPLHSTVVTHRQGRALEAEVALADGWAIVRAVPK